MSCYPVACDDTAHRIAEVAVDHLVLGIFFGALCIGISFGAAAVTWLRDRAETHLGEELGRLPP